MLEQVLGMSYRRSAGTCCLKLCIFEMIVMALIHTSSTCAIVQYLILGSHLWDGVSDHGNMYTYFPKPHGTAVFFFFKFNAKLHCLCILLTFCTWKKHYHSPGLKMFCIILHLILHRKSLSNVWTACLCTFCEQIHYHSTPVYWTVFRLMRHKNTEIWI